MLDEYNTVLTIQELMDVLNIGSNSAYGLLTAVRSALFESGAGGKYRKMLLLTTSNSGNKATRYRS